MFIKSKTPSAFKLLGQCNQTRVSFQRTQSEQYANSEVAL